MAAKPSASPSPSSDWEAVWNRAVAAAREEGTVTVAGPPGDTYRAALTAFEQAYPGIKVELTGFRGNDVVSRVSTEQRAGQYLWDVGVIGAGSSFTGLKPAGALTPLRPALILPEVLQNDAWLGGLDNSFADTGKEFVLNFEANLLMNVYVNRDIVPESELNQVEQLLDPKWRGKIAWDDPRMPGHGNGRARYWLVSMGEDFVRQMLSVQMALTTEARQLVEWAVRGTYPIAVGIDQATLDGFQKQGAGLNVKPLAPDTTAGAQLSTGFGNAELFQRPPHPNAAKVFINWLLSKEGQIKWSTATKANSRRLDVPVVDPLTAPDPKKSYASADYEVALPFRQRATDLAKELIKA